MGFSKSSAKRKVHSNTNLPQEARETSSKQPNFTPKATKKKTKNKNKKRNGQFLRKYNRVKLNQEETENLNRQITSTEVESSNKQNPRTQANFTKNLERGNTYPTKTLPENCRGRKTPQFIL